MTYIGALPGRSRPILESMPAKPKTAFVCQNCGAQSPKWVGRCPSCDGWNTLVEERVVAPPKGRGVARAPRAPIALNEVPADAETRIPTGIGEFDRVLGGGIVRGSCVLLGGDPGIGKSSLLMQASSSLAQRGDVLYVSGEESAAQIKLRARRFGIEGGKIYVQSETDLGTIIESTRRLRPIFTVIDSIQTMSSDEVGVFEMGESGLREVANPSEVFLEERSRGVAGSVVVPTVEGTRPLLVEVQALVTPTSFGLPRRTVSGADPQRLAVLLAVLAKRAGVALGQHDVYVNLVGGLKVREPAADLAVAVALASALRDRAADPRTVFVGELGLGGELRRVQRIAARRKEAERLGFERAVVPSASLGDLNGTGLEVIGAPTLRDALM